jgi:catechol 2,3-dioxygenase-like lactoylglutathione lyase family enzyme
MQATYKNIISFLWTTDTARSLAFYTNVLGLRKVFEADGWVELAIPGTSNAYLALNRWTQDDRAPRNDFLTFGVEGLDTFKRALEDAGVRLKGGIIELEEQGLRMLKFYDPEGNVITLAEVRS